MDGNDFDRITRAVARRVSRRGVFAMAGAVAAVRSRGSDAAAQLGPPSCGQAGDVCTRLLGCCSGFTCVTSAINVNYGVCVSGGSGGTVSSGTGLISPFSDGIEQEVANLATDTSTTSTTTTGTGDGVRASAEERKARRVARKNEIQSRRTTRQNRIETRRDTRQTERAADREEARLAEGPAVEGEIFNQGLNEPDGSRPEMLKVTNRDTGSITLMKIESILDPSIDGPFTETSNPTLAVGASFKFYSNEYWFQHEDELDDSVEYAWIGEPICDGKPGAGFRVYVAFSTNAPNREYEFLCDSPFSAAPLPAGTTTTVGRDRRKKRKQRRPQVRRKQAAKQRRNKKRGKR